ncbi:MAG: hypothetical protein ACRDT4_03115 [Micromonosporaceae bacterium]
MRGEPVSPTDRPRRRRKPPPDPPGDGYVPGDYGDEIDWFAQLRSTGPSRRERPFGQKENESPPRRDAGRTGPRPTDRVELLPPGHGVAAESRGRRSRRGAVVDGEVTGEMPAVNDAAAPPRTPPPPTRSTPPPRALPPPERPTPPPARSHPAPPHTTPPHPTGYGPPPVPQPPAPGKPTRAERARAKRAREEEARAEQARAEQARAERFRAERAQAERAQAERTTAAGADQRAPARRPVTAPDPERRAGARPGPPPGRTEQRSEPPPGRTDQRSGPPPGRTEERPGRGRRGEDRSGPARRRGERPDGRRAGDQRAGGVPPGKTAGKSRPDSRPRTVAAASAGSSGAVSGTLTRWRELLRQPERLRQITLICVAVVLLGALPAFFGIRYATRDPGFRALDALDLPAWASENVQDRAVGSRWCIDTCRVRQRLWESERDTTSTVTAYHDALRAEGWKRWDVDGCPPKRVRGEYSCWRRDAYTLDLWVRLPECRRNGGGAGAEGAAPGDQCPGSVVTVVVRNAGADRRLQ